MLAMITVAALWQRAAWLLIQANGCRNACHRRKIRDGKKALANTFASPPERKLKRSIHSLPIHPDTSGSSLSFPASD
jgi:hypothetical protein